jgi:hypothetical protein
MKIAKIERFWSDFDVLDTNSTKIILVLGSEDEAEVAIDLGAAREAPELKKNAFRVLKRALGARFWTKIDEFYKV